MGAAISLVCGLTAQAAQVQQAVSPAVKHDVSLPLREMAAMALVTGEEKGLGELDEESYAKRLAVKKVGEPVEDLIVQRSQPKKLVTTPGLSFDGVPGVSYKVPDTNGAVGATQYVQWVNTRYAVYNKTTGKKVLGPVAGNAFWQGFGGPCQSTNDGDIIVRQGGSPLGNDASCGQRSLSGVCCRFHYIRRHRRLLSLRLRQSIQQLFHRLREARCLA
jgi:hypothetical protein